MTAVMIQTRSQLRTAAFVAVSGGLLATASACAPQGNSTDPDYAGGVTTCDYPSSGVEPAKPVDPPPSSDVPAEGEVTYTIEMNEGPVTITMDRSKAPCAVNSFASLAEQGYFDDTQCHRLTDQGLFVLQCGDPTGTGTGGPGYAFADEEAGEYTRGTVAMANSGPNTNGSQFFLVYEDSPLSPDYTILGHMDDASVDTVGTMAGESHDSSNGPGDGKPNNEARIQSVTRK